MSQTVPSQHPTVVLRSNYQRLRSLLAIAILMIVGLTVAVVVLATSSDRTALVVPDIGRTPSVISANPSAEPGARLDHRGLKTAVPRPAASDYASALQYFHTHEQ